MCNLPDGLDGFAHEFRVHFTDVEGQFGEYLLKVLVVADSHLYQIIKRFNHYVEFLVLHVVGFIKRTEENLNIILEEHGVLLEDNGHVAEDYILDLRLIPSDQGDE